MNVNIALLTVTDTRTFENDKSGAILVKKIQEGKHNLINRKICKDNKKDIKKILKEWIKKKDIDVIITQVELDLLVEISLQKQLKKLQINISLVLEKYLEL